MKGSKIMMKKGFTLAEVLITLAIIGVVAALTIPSVILNTNQQEYKTGLKKAVSVLNQAISMNMAIDNVSPNDIENVAQMVNYFSNRMNTLSSDTTRGQFYTTDGMRFQFLTAAGAARVAGSCGREAGNTTATCTGGTNSTSCGAITGCAWSNGASVAYCGGSNDPCYLVVDVNGDRKPNLYSNVTNANTDNVPTNTNDSIKDIFYIKITEDSALPAGNLAQQVMFN